MNERSAVIVGGGIGGLATAAGLLRRGWSVQVLEQAPEFTEVGAGISLWPNAFRALDAIGIGDAVRAVGAQEVTGGIRDHRGRPIVRAEISSPTAAATMFHRAELLSALLGTVPREHLTAGTRVHAVRNAGDRAVVEHDHGTLTADVVIGADGVRSTVRTQLWTLAEPPRYAGVSSWRTVISGFGSVPGGESWGPGALFGVIPMSRDRVYCYASAAVPSGRMSADGELATLRRRFGTWHDPIAALLEAAREEEVLRHDVYHLPPLDGYVNGRAVLVGDAAHAMTPNLGQGACQSLEDAATLAVLLGSESNVDTALREYNALRVRRSQAIASRSRSTGRLSQLRSPVAIALRNAAVRLLPGSVFARSINSVLDWTPPANAIPTGSVLP
jgi:2-polyprenyl-6-methoxyphenol hydroxylase-like FAD-dependent oxidoreductase